MATKKKGGKGKGSTPQSVNWTKVPGKGRAKKKGGKGRVPAI